MANDLLSKGDCKGMQGVDDNFNFFPGQLLFGEINVRVPNSSNGPN